MAAFDFKKEYKDLYQPKPTPSIIEVPEMNYIAVRGKGNPNDENGTYKTAIGLLYGIAYTLKMSYKTEHQIPGFFQYSVPPLEGFWWQPGVEDFDYAHKEDFHWISAICLPEFVTKDEFDWALKEATIKKKTDFSAVEYATIAEGLCVQCMHIGPYDDEPRTVTAMRQYAKKQGYAEDFSAERLHHEIYLSDPRRSDPVKLKTVIRHPIRKA
ncbi:MAG: GyrI-like domain-containing protein [Clostridia bacterium]|nr:GyrI-like domain-containing protein [Clostridia bacterium]